MTAGFTGMMSLRPSMPWRGQDSLCRLSDAPLHRKAAFWVPVDSLMDSRLHHPLSAVHVDIFWLRPSIPSG